MPRTTEVADNVIAVAETASTNTLARQMLRDGTMAPPADGGAGVVVVATDVQSAGRGRLERTWVSAPGESMTCSYIATLPAGVIADGSVNGWLTVIAGFAALDALRGALAECGVASEDCGLRLKWPNDLFCQGRKLGGILTEMVPLPGQRGAGDRHRHQPRDTGRPVAHGAVHVTATACAGAARCPDTA